MIHFVWFCLFESWLPQRRRSHGKSWIHTHTNKKVIKREMCAVFKRTHSGTKLQTELHFLAHRINHLHFLLEQCTRGGGEPIMPFKVGPESSLFTVSSRLHSTITGRIHHIFLFVAGNFFLSALKDVECGSERRRKRWKERLREKGLCISLYIKSIISVIATKGQGLEFHSLSCTTGAVTVTDSLSPCCEVACRSALWEQREKAESTL